jgi:KipI family sensor histidine kinase inhibitor
MSTVTTTGKAAVSLQVAECGDAAIRVCATGGTTETQWRSVQHLADVLSDAAIPGLYGVVPTYESVLVEFDCELTDHDVITNLVTQVAEDIRHGAIDRPAPRSFRVPVVYGGHRGPDLQFVANHLGISTEAVIDLHTAKPFTIRCLGAPAGSPMMDGPDFGMPIPRLMTPRTTAQAGVVSVAGTQAVIAPAASPGGWQILGQTPLTLLDLTRDPFISYRPGDTVQFFPITESDWATYAGIYLEPDHG